MDEEDEQQDEQPCGSNGVVRVPVHPAEVLDEGRRQQFIEAPADAASHWDERIWRRA